MPARPFLADSKDVFRGRVKRDDQQVSIEQNNTGAQVIENALGVATQLVVVGTAETGVVGARVWRCYGAVACGLSTLVCCT